MQATKESLNVDLRSDTVTQPCAAMRAAMAEAPVGDDVIGDDPTVIKLQETIAELLGKEAAIFMPSGSMTNQVAVRLHCQPGDELLCEAECHIFNYEQGAFAQLSGVVARCVHGESGVLHPEQLVDKVRPDDDHAARTSMIALENTHNRGGGTVQPLELVDQICGWASEQGLATHLDGARLFNAVAASGVPAARWAQGFDTVSVCFSKGLGAPVGSALVGSAGAIRQARRVRKAFGGGMRQAGIIAAGALFAIQNNIERLPTDHQHASILADAAKRSGLTLTSEPQTNIVIVRIHAESGNSAEFVEALRQHGVAALPFGPQDVRFVTHLDVTPSQIEKACEAIEQVASRFV